MLFKISYQFERLNHTKRNQHKSNEYSHQPELLKLDLWLLDMKIVSTFEAWCSEDLKLNMYWKNQTEENNKWTRIHYFLLLSCYLSVMRLHWFKFKSSILLQYCEKVFIAESPTDWQPFRLNCLRKPPHLLAMFSTTTPWQGKNNRYEKLAFWTFNLTTLPQHLFGS